jgi:hypothetical protein|tara:strand:- start:4141 stop:5058 length:918 start_codon:yes stop_codon:yes gene_type:complete
METVVSLNEDPLEIQSDLKVFLDKQFDFVYNHNGFFIVANNDTPKNTIADTTGEKMWLKIVEYVRDLMIKPELPTAKTFYGKLSTNFILAYGTHGFLNEIYPIILEKFHRQMIPIYDDSKLDYSYLNTDIIITKLDDITWKSYGFNKKYNEIIEVILKIIFSTLSIAYPTDWSFEQLNNLYIILNRDVEDGYYIPKHYSVSKAIKNYIYQIWLLTFHDHTKILSPQQKKIHALLYKYKDKGIPFTISNELTSSFNIDTTIINKKDSQISLLGEIYNNLSVRTLIILLVICIIIFIILMLKIYNVF